MFAGGLLAQNALPEHLRAGVAKAESHPTERSARLADSIRDHLFARAIVVDEGSTCAVLVGLDLRGASNAICASGPIGRSASSREPLV